MLSGLAEKDDKSQTTRIESRRSRDYIFQETDSYVKEQLLGGAQQENPLAPAAIPGHN